MPESEIVFACDEQQATIRQGTIDGSHIMIDWLRANAPKEIQDAYFADIFWIWFIAMIQNATRNPALTKP